MTFAGFGREKFCYHWGATGGNSAENYVDDIPILLVEPIYQKSEQAMGAIGQLAVSALESQDKSLSGAGFQTLTDTTIWIDDEQKYYIKGKLKKHLKDGTNVEVE